MATGPVTNVNDVIVPEIFSPYVQQLTEQKSRIIQSGAVQRSPQMDAFLASGGLLFKAPSLKDLDDDEDNVSTSDDPDHYSGGSADSTPKKIVTGEEVFVRLSRNQSWGTADLTSALAGNDVAGAIANLVAGYWARRLQAAVVSVINGVFNDNAAAPVGTEHVLNDLTNDTSILNAGVYQAGLTDFSGPAFIDAAVTMGDSMEDLSLIIVHSIVYARMQKNNLIDFIPDSTGKVSIPTYLGRAVIVDDGVTVDGGVFNTWLFGAGALLLGVSSPDVPTETSRHSDSGNGGGATILHNRVEWGIHPRGHRFNATPSEGGPSNANTVGNLSHADSWQRVYNERKQIKIARLVTREF